MTNNTSEYHQRIVRDPVHGYIRLPSDIFSSLIDTPLFQRLRDIRQLGQAHLVYPGAMHTRFEHSLGTAYIMDKMIKSIIENTSEYVVKDFREEQHKMVVKYLEGILKELKRLRREAVVAALLHDIGHMMLSHVFEAAIHDYIHYVIGGRYPNLQHHEELTLRIAGILREMDIVFEGQKVNMDTVIDILTTAYEDKGSTASSSDGEAGEKADSSMKRAAIKIIAQLISSDIDVDRADYMLRDSYYSGTVEGLYDLERLYSVIVIAPRVKERLGGKEEEKDVEIQVGVVEKGVSVIENMLLARVYMYTDVYLHTVSMIYSGMAARLIALLYALHPNLAKRFPGGYCLHKILDMNIESERKLKNCVMQLTDTTFNMLVRKTRSPRFMKKVYATAMSLSSGEKIDLTNICKTLAAMYLIAEALHHRRHWSAYVLEGSAAETATKELRDANSEYIRAIRDSIDQFLIVSTSSYRAYRCSDKDFIPVYLRKFHQSVPLHESAPSMVARNICRRRYAKVVIIFPPYGHNLGGEKLPAYWNVKRGKPVSLKILSNVAEICETPVQEIGNCLKRSAEKAFELAEKLAQLVSRRNPP